MEIQLGLIGYPIKHSLSPWIHQHFLQNENLEGTYSILEVKEDSLHQEVNNLKEQGYKGFNVTLPFKQKIIPLLDDIDESARKIGAVNTVLNQNGQLVGFNTDGIGYLRSLEKFYPKLMSAKDIRILLIGAGGAARGIFYALSQAGFMRVDIVNRTPAHATLIAQLGAAYTKTDILSLEQAKKQIPNYDLIIQTTSVGMKPNDYLTPIKLTGLQETTVVSDIIYQPIWTTFLKEAASQGARIHHGHTMLLYQAQYAFEIWFGKRPKMNNLDLELKRILEG